MAYTSANLVLTAQAIAGPKIWTYSSVDNAATAAGSEYFTDGVARGMSLGDLIYGFDTDASPIDGYVLIVTNVNAATVEASEYQAITST